MLCRSGIWRRNRDIVGTGPRRGILNIVVPGHMFSHDGDSVARVLGKKEGRCQGGYAGSIKL